MLIEVKLICGSRSSGKAGEVATAVKKKLNNKTIIFLPFLCRIQVMRVHALILASSVSVCAINWANLIKLTFGVKRNLNGYNLCSLPRKT